MTGRLAKKRSYTLGARAAAAEQTRLRIEQATIALFYERYVDEITLDEIAARAGVAVQTILRRFGSRDGLLSALADSVNRSVKRQRGEAPVGDVPGAIDNLLEDYERWGDGAIRALAQEERSPILQKMNADGRALHYAWIERAFGPWLCQRRGAARARLFAGLMAACDVYVWKLLRRDLSLGADETRRTLIEMVSALLGGEH